MNILDKIVAQKRQEVAERKSLFPVKLLEKSIYFPSPTVSLARYVNRPDKSGIIAEIKRKSPSKGMINPYVSVERTSIGYMQAGASALSVLTDTEFFGGTNDDLKTARKFNFCPVLRKDFTVDEYQIIEAKSIGADAILLIAAVLSPPEIYALTQVATSLGLEVLLEVHNADELKANLDNGASIIGVNNRNLKTFEVSLDTSIQLAALMPPTVTKISESGIDTPDKIITLRKHGFRGFLIGENFMRHNRPELACKEFIDDLRKLEITAP